MEYYNDYLMHYGVKGMKWGVRRYQNKDGSLTSIGRQRYLAQSVAKKLDVTKPYDSEGWMYSDEFNHDRILKKGSMVYRYSSVENERNSGHTFVYYTKNDNTEYADAGNDGLATYGAYYKHRMTVKKDIVIPSTKNMLQTYIEMTYLDSDTMNRTMTELAQRSGKHKLPKEWLDEHGKLTLEQARLKLYNEANSDIYKSFRRFTGSMLRGSANDLGVSGEEYIKRLSEKGYNAIPDLNDNIGNRQDGYTGRFDSPTLIFDRAESLKSEGLDNTYYKNFEEKYKIENVR